MPFKVQTLEIKFNEQLKERSKVMGIVESVINEAREEGLEEGLVQGLQRGREEAERSKDLAFVQSLIRNTDYSDEEIASLAAVDVSFVRRLRCSTYS